MKHKPINMLPKRRGVVMRGDGVIRDSYSTEYVRDEGTGQLYRVSAKAVRNPPRSMFDLDAVMTAFKQDAPLEQI